MLYDIWSEFAIELPDEIDPILEQKIEFIKKSILKIDENFIL